MFAETPLSPAQWDLVNTIRCSGETLLTLISDILDFSRIEANKMVCRRVYAVILLHVNWWLINHKLAIQTCSIQH